MSLLDYQSFLLNESAMAPIQWKKHDGKYRTAFLELLNKNGSIELDPEYSSKWGMSSIAVSSIENLNDLKNYVNSNKVIDKNGPFMVVGKLTIPLTNILKTGQLHVGGKTSTDTDIKESMVVYYYYNPNIDVLADNEAASAACGNIPTNALHAKVFAKLQNWLLTVDDDVSDKLADWKSSANALPSGLFLDRGDLYSFVKTAGFRLSGVGSVDQWCPGDVYLYNRGDSSLITSHVNSSTEIGQLNLLFSNSLNPNHGTVYGVITAISLKEEAARSGKAKGFIKNISNKDTIYNLTKDEIKMCSDEPDKAIIAISDWQTKIEGVLNSSGLSTHYIKGDPNKLSLKQLPQKLASQKLCYYLLTLPSGSPNEVDTNLLGIYKFGMKQGNSDVNPPYYKVSGSTSGNAKVERITSGDVISLLLGGNDSKETQMVINDSDTRQDILLFYYLSKGDDMYEITLVIGGGGNSQGKMEFFSPILIGNVKNDPSVANSVINMVQQRSSGNVKR